jgi:small subunit ribosomal protein S18
MAKPVRTKNKDNARRAKKKISLLITDRVEYVDWKDVNLLRRFMSDRAKIRARRVSGNNAQQQAEIAKAIKNAREMALLPYASRVTQTRGPKRDGERGGRRERDRDLPAPDITPLSATADADVELDDTYGEGVDGVDEVVEDGGTDELVAAETGGSEEES